MGFLNLTHAAAPRALRAPLGACLVLSLAACVPDIDDDLSLVQGERVLAVVAEPPEAGEGDRVSLTALVASDSGPTGANPSYAFCLTRKPLSELGPVDPSCLNGTQALLELGQGARVDGSIDRSACSLFGPRRPSPEPGQPAGRAVDPDPTGGFYQPVMASLPGQAPVLGGVRLDCGLPAADRATVIDYNQRHRPNANPGIERLEIDTGAGWAPLEANAAAPVPAGERVVLRTSWAACASDVACNGAESYVLLDPETRTLVDRTETIVASWYATAGVFEEYRTDALDAALSQAENGWIAPAEPGPVGVWVVLRDGRGGVGFAAYRFEIQ